MANIQALSIGDAVHVKLMQIWAWDILDTASTVKLLWDRTSFLVTKVGIPSCFDVTLMSTMSTRGQINAG
jgi:hypothetical protein